MTTAADIYKKYNIDLTKPKELESGVPSREDNTQFDDMFESDTREGEKLKKKDLYRRDRLNKPETSLKCKEISKNLGWCDDVKYPKKYNRLVNIQDKFKCEKLKRDDHKYDLFIPIKYNFNNPIVGLGSAIFIHLTKNYTPTAGCIALSKKDFLIMLKIIKKNTKIKIL